MELGNLSKRKKKNLDARITRALNARVTWRVMSDEVDNDEVSEESVFGFATGQAKYAMPYVTQY